MVQRKDSYVPKFYTEYRYDIPMLLKGSMNGIVINGFDHEDFRHKSIDTNIYFQDTDVCKLLKEVLRRENRKYEESQKE